MGRTGRKSNFEPCPTCWTLKGRKLQGGLTNADGQMGILFHIFLVRWRTLWANESICDAMDPPLNTPKSDTIKWSASLAVWTCILDIDPYPTELLIDSWDLDGRGSATATGDAAATADDDAAADDDDDHHHHHHHHLNYIYVYIYVYTYINYIYIYK